MELKQGDYVRTELIKSDTEFRAIAKVFLDAGCFRGELDYISPEDYFQYAGWGSDGFLFSSYAGVFFNEDGEAGRELTAEQILGRGKVHRLSGYDETPFNIRTECVVTQDQVVLSREATVFLLRALSAVEGAWLVGDGTRAQYVTERYIDPAVAMLSEKLK